MFSGETRVLIHVSLCYCFNNFRNYFLCAATIMWRNKASYILAHDRQPLRHIQLSTDEHGCTVTTAVVKVTYQEESKQNDAKDGV